MMRKRKLRRVAMARKVTQESILASNWPPHLKSLIELARSLCHSWATCSTGAPHLSFGVIWLIAARLFFCRATQLHMYASTVLGIVIMSVSLPVRHTRAFWQNQTIHYGYFDTTRNGNHSSFLTPTVVGGWRPFRLKFALKVTQPFSKNAAFDRFPLITS